MVIFPQRKIYQNWFHVKSEWQRKLTIAPLTLFWQNFRENIFKSTKKVDFTKYFSVQKRISRFSTILCENCRDLFVQVIFLEKFREINSMIEKQVAFTNFFQVRVKSSFFHTVKHLPIPIDILDKVIMNIAIEKFLFTEYEKNYQRHIRVMIVPFVGRI